MFQNHTGKKTVGPLSHGNNPHPLRRIDGNEEDKGALRRDRILEERLRKTSKRRYVWYVLSFEN